MSKLIHNIETGEIEIVPLTDKEIALSEQLQNDLEAKKEAKAAAEAKLLALGLTAQDLKVLGLG